MRFIMSNFLITTLITNALVTAAAYGATAKDMRKFPEGFRFGVATSAYQVEGAWNQTGKGWSIWDVGTHMFPDKIVGRVNGDIACDSFHKYKEDVRHMKRLGVDLYRFSISWTRIMPRGLPDEINQAGVDYYHNLIDELLANGIQPMVTMFHWDLPEHLQNMGGFMNSNFPNFFADYANFLFKTYGYKIKLWSTFNEPVGVTDGYGSTTMMPLLNLHGTGDYIAGHNLLKAHAKVYHLYRDSYAYQGGNITIDQFGVDCIPKTDSQEDAEAVERCFAFGFDYFLHPIFSEKGDYPDIVKTQVAKLSKEQGVPNRLPQFTKEEIDYIRGTADHLSIHAYTTSIVTSGRDPEASTPSMAQDEEFIASHDPNWPTSASSWLFSVPDGMRRSLNWVKTKYPGFPIYLTELGFSDRGTLEDDSRIDFYSAYFEAIKQAILDDGCNVVGITAWSLLDNFEWLVGYSQTFGFLHVDFDSPERTRTWKKSAHWYKEFIEFNKK